MSFTLTDNLVADCKAITADEPNVVANLANIAAVLFYELPDISWCGFYILDPEAKNLVLGPFQGKVACVRISKERGVCGAAWRENKTQRISDVEAFPGHIACDSATRSELVIPIHVSGKFWGVLDLDSKKLDRFDEAVAQKIERLVQEVIVPLLQRGNYV